MMHMFSRVWKFGLVKSFDSVSATSKNLLALFIFFISLHIAAMMYFEQWSLEVALWFTVTAGTTVGFGDYSPATGWGRLSTVLLIYVPAIPTIAFLTGRLVDRVVSRRERKLKGNWRWKMDDHIVFINYPDIGGDLFFQKIVEELSTSILAMSAKKIIILTDKKPDGLPQKLVDMGVKLVSGRPNSESSLERASVMTAKKVIILCEDFADSRSDSLVFDIASLIMLKESETHPEIVAEAILETTKQRLGKLGVKSVLRPIRAYPELVARTIIAPGSEQIIESLFDSSQEECLKFNCNYNGKWAKLAITLIEADYGTAIAVELIDGSIKANLRAKDEIHIKAVFIIVAEENNVNPKDEIDIMALL